MTELTYLLDSNVLIALASRNHTLHDRARNWFGSIENFATCPITEGSLVRFAFYANPNSGLSFGKSLLQAFKAMKNYVFWPDDLSYLKVPDTGIYGHKQVTDAYLAT